MTYTVLRGKLNPSMPYRTINVSKLLMGSLIIRLLPLCRCRMREKTSYGTSEMMLISLYVGEVPVVGQQRSREDPTAVQILQQYQPSLLQRYSPRYVAADGNCCYRAAALALFGTADYFFYTFFPILSVLQLLKKIFKI